MAAELALNELTNALGSPEIVLLLLSNTIILLFKLHAIRNVCVCVCLFGVAVHV